MKSRPASAWSAAARPSTGSSSLGHTELFSEELSTGGGGMAATTTLIDAKRVLGDGASYRVRARIDQQALARLVGEMTARAAEQGSLTLAEGAIVITAERTGQLPESDMEA